ncbi:MAG: (d)CMP kinase [Alphaproteobacteria bacterium]|nr:(d)CMP kinase [Alphaproteobacteria bacterium]
MIIAVDGPAASGKGTLGRRLAGHFGFAFLDTGLLYRATALHLAEMGGDADDAAVAAQAAERVRGDELGDERLRSEAIGRLASAVAAVPSVRAALLGFQRQFAARPPGGKAGAVLDGRDIGTVICPDADAKIFITASIEVRARRRLKELRDRGAEVIYQSVLQDMHDRDARDSQRQAAPLRPAGDALVLDTTDLDADAAFAAARDFVAGKLAAK